MLSSWMLLSFNHVPPIADKYAVVLDVAQFSLEQKTSCDLEKMKEDFYPFPVAVGLQNNSVYTQHVSMA